jgi:hypothetical protein
MNGPSSDLIELTILTKDGGPLTKTIRLGVDGKPVSDSTQCKMAKGSARREFIDGVEGLAALIAGLASNQALALGVLRPDLGDSVGITTKGKLNGEHADLIARTGKDIIYRKDKACFGLFDLDQKGMPPEVKDRIKAVGYWNILVEVLPELAHAARVIRTSTSAGLMRTDTGEVFTGSGGLHAYIIIMDGTDFERFLKTLQDRCWLAGLGWIWVSDSGQLLMRSIVDSTVWGSERLVFEGQPPVESPLEQDPEKRKPIFVSGNVINSVETCPPLTIVQKQTLSQLIAKERQRVEPERIEKRNAFITKQIERRMQEGCCSEETARRIIELSYNGTLLPDHKLILEDGTEITVGDVLAAPGRFEGLRLADPIEGLPGDPRIAKIMRGSDGMPFIHSFSHGKGMYRLRYDAAFLRSAMETSPDPVETLAQMVIVAELDDVELDLLIKDAAAQAKVGVKVVKAKVKAAQKANEQRIARDAKERRLAERSDPRPQIPCPPNNAPWLPEMQNVNEVLAHASPKVQTRRDVDCGVTRGRKWRVPKTHQFSSATANKEDER